MDGNADPNPPRSVLVYDGDCGFCEATSAWLVRRGVIREEQRRPFQAFEREDRERLLDAGIRNELLVVLPDGRMRGGVAGLAALHAEAGRSATAALLSWRPTRALGDLAYRLVAHNRRIVAPVPWARREACACDPDPSAGRRVLFVGGLLVVSFAVAALFGHVAGHGAARGLLALSLAVLPVLLAAFWPGGDRRGEWIAHFALVLAGAALAEAVALLPLLGIARLAGWSPSAAVALATAVGCFVLLGLAVRRCRRLGASPWLGVVVAAWVTLALALAGWLLP